MLQNVLDLGGEVERQLGKRRVQGADDLQGVSRTIQEVGIAKRDVRGPRADVPANVFQDDVLRNDEEPSAINGRDRTMRTQVTASTARLDVADHPAFALVFEAGILFERRQRRADWQREGQPPKKRLGRLAALVDALDS